MKALFVKVKTAVLDAARWLKALFTRDIQVDVITDDSCQPVPDIIIDVNNFPSLDDFRAMITDAFGTNPPPFPAT